MPDNQLIPENREVQSALSDSLTRKNWKFIDAISRGLKPPEAYIVAGYKGKNEQMPYQMMHTLKHKIAEHLKSKGFNQETVAVEIDKLLTLPLRSDQTAVTIDQKIKMIRLLKDALPEAERKPSTFSRFTIVNNVLSSDGRSGPNCPTNGQPTTAETSNVLHTLDAELVEENKTIDNQG